MAAHAQSAEAKQNQDYDVIVVGCGCAGMAAAIEAADKGAKVAIFEKDVSSCRKHNLCRWSLQCN